MKKVLIANRGEIALRIIRACREMGLATVAVYSDVDRAAPHVLAADEAARLGPAPASESYLRGDRIISAARILDADAIHPGYGFLSENAAFADACRAAELTFIGPPASAMLALGSKTTAGAKAGTLSAKGPVNTAETTVSLAKEVTAPSIWWRLTHPLELFGIDKQ